MSDESRGDRPADTTSPTDECGWREWFATGPGIKLLIDPANGRILEASNAAAAFYGYPREILRTMFASDISVLPRSELRARLAQAVGSPGGVRYPRVQQRLASGEIRIVDAFAGVVTLGARRDLEVVVHDVTAEMQAQRRLERLAMAVEQSTESVVITDADAIIEYVNPAFERLTGYASSEVVGRNPRILKSGVQSPTFYDAMWAALTNGLPWVADLTNRRKDGTVFQEEAVITPLRADDGTISGYVAVKRDVTRERALEAAGAAVQRERAFILDTLRLLPAGMSPEASGRAICDQVVSMTGLSHAHLFLFSPDGTAVPIGLSTDDGSSAPGRALARERTTYLRERAAVGPWIEDWAPMPDHPYDGLLGRLGVRAAAYVPVRADNVLVGLLIVGAAAGDATETLSIALPSLLDSAEVAGAMLAPALLEQDALHRARQRIDGIIADRGFYPVFQPIVALADDRIVGFEALSRFTEGTAPDQVFAEARRAGRGVELELATLAGALQDTATLPPLAFLSVNVSPDVIRGHADVAAILAGCARPLVVEVTEHASIVDYAELRDALARAAPGARLAVDDAGSGVANFDHLVGLRPQFIKVDGGLIRGVDVDPARQALIVALLHFAAETRAEVIAEGIETVAELRTLRRLGVGLGQGFLLGRPAVAAAWAAGPAPRAASPIGGARVGRSQGPDAPRPEEHALVRLA